MEGGEGYNILNGKFLLIFNNFDPFDPFGLILIGFRAPDTGKVQFLHAG